MKFALSLVLLALCANQVLSVPVEGAKEAEGVGAKETPKVEAQIKETQKKIDELVDTNPEIKQSLVGPTDNFRTTMLGMLTTTITRFNGLNSEMVGALHSLSQGISTHSLDLTRAVAYVPYLLSVDGPVHMLKMFVMMREEGRIPLDYRDAVDTVEKYLEQTQHRDIMERLVIPISSYPEKMVQTFQNFMVSFMKSFASFAG